MVHFIAPRATLALLCVLAAVNGVTARPPHSTTTTTTTFPPQPQLITLAPPVATATLDPSLGNAVLDTAEEKQRVHMNDDQDDDNTDTDPYPSLANPRGHYLYRYTKRSALGVRPLSRKGKTRLQTSNNGKWRRVNEVGADEDWRIWRLQYARQQQWRRCRTLQFGPCPDGE